MIKFEYSMVMTLLVAVSNLEPTLSQCPIIFLGPTAPDPIPIDELTIPFTHDRFKGNFTFRNGTITGLSSAHYTPELSVPHGHLKVDANLSGISISGGYDVVNGYANYSGEYNFSGNGNFLLNMSGIQGKIQVYMKKNATTGQEYIDKHQLVWSMRNGTVQADNFLLNGAPIDANLVNHNLESFMKFAWAAAGDAVVEKINEQIEGCSLQDLVSVLGAGAITTTERSKQIDKAEVAKTESFLGHSSTVAPAVTTIMPSTKGGGEKESGGSTVMWLCVLCLIFKQFA